MAWSKQLNSTLQEVGLSVVPTPGDGHCLLHAIRRSWQVQTQDPVPSIEVMLSELHREALVNNGRYKNFFCGPFPLYKQQMYSYLYSKVFDTTFVDLVPLMLCNSLCIGISVYNEHDDGRITFIDVVPSNGHPPRHIVYLHRKRKHYSALEFCSYRPRPSAPSAPSVPPRQETDEWRSASSGRRTQWREARPTQDRDEPVKVQNRFAGLSIDDEEPRVGSIIEKASRPIPKRVKPNKPKSSHLKKHTNLVDVIQTQMLENQKYVEKTSIKKEVIVIGTSLVRGVGLKLNDDNLDVLTYTNAGCSINHIHPRIKHMVPPNFDGSLLFQIGGNDCSNNDSEHVINAYEVLLNDVKSFVPNAKIFVSAIPPRRGSDYLRYKIQNVNEFLHFRSTFDDNITFIDCPVFDQKLHFRNDGVHFSEYGRSIYVSNLRQSLIKNFQMVPLRRKPR
jgi:hypothetical protein